MMKKLLVSFLSLLLTAATTTAAAQAAKPKLAVFVVGMDDWKFGDVLAHIVGEELNRSKSYQVVTRSGAVQVKLKKLRRAAFERLDAHDLRTWGRQHGVEHICLITTPDDKNFSAHLLDLSSCETLCGESSVSGSLGAVALKELAWSLAGQLRGGSPLVSPSCTYTESWNGLGLEMVCVAGDTFTMGCINDRDNYYEGKYHCGYLELHGHSVLLGNFWIGKHEITQAQWFTVMGTTIREQQAKAIAEGHSETALYGVGDDFPMYHVNYAEAKAFCDTLSARTGKKYRLPTEAEWEYAARGGRLSRGYMFSGSNNIRDVAWYDKTSGNTTHKVGTTKQANELGIYDMTGNVWEFCSDLVDEEAGFPSTSSVLVNPESTAGRFCMVRGCRWWNTASVCRISVRVFYSPTIHTYNMGFRVV